MSTLSAAGRLAQAGHLRDVAAQRDEPAGAGVGADVAHREREVLRRVEQRRDRTTATGASWPCRRGSVPSPSCGELADLLLGLGIEVDVRRHRRRVLATASILSWIVQSSSYSGWKLLGCSHASTTAVARSAAPMPPLAKPSLASAPNAPASSARRLTSSTSSFGVARAAVDRDHGGQAELPDDPEVAAHVRHPASRSRRSPCWRSTRGSSSIPPWCLIARTVVTSTTALGVQAAEAADDVEELLHPHVRAEARLGHDVVAELHADAVGDERVVAVGDVRERAAVHQARLALERLDQVRLDRVLEQHRHRARRAEILGGDRPAAVEGVRDRDRAQPLAQVVQVARDGHDRHDLGRGRDVEARSRAGSRSRGRRGRSRSGAARGRSCPAHAATRRAAASILCGLPCRIDASSIAASRLLAAPIAWMSPVKWRLRSSIGTTCVMPPPAAPPLIPKTGPSDGSRRHATGLLADRAEALGEPDERRRLALAGLRRRHARDARRSCRRDGPSSGRGRRGRSSPCSGRRARSPRPPGRDPPRSARSG